MKQGWRTYWKEPGDSGLAPTFEWSLPPGFEVDEVSWPLPTWHKAEDVWTMIYEPEVLIVFRMRAPKTPPSVAELSVRVDWLVCHDEMGCFTGDAVLSLRIPRSTGEVAEASVDAAAFDLQRETAPRAMPTTWSLSPDRRLLRLGGEGPWTDPRAAFDFFPEAFDAFDRDASLGPERSGGVLALRLPFLQTADPYPDAFHGVLRIRTEDRTYGYAIGWGEEEPIVSSPARRERAGSESSRGPWVLALLVALAAGLVFLLRVRRRSDT
jgi:thiol:disulfide interchange protein DsbD